MGFIAPVIPDFTKATAASKQIIKRIGDPKNKVASEATRSGQEIRHLRGELEVKDVSFSYPERPTVTVLNRLSLHIPANKVTAIVGSSGSGKSTIVGLLVSFMPRLICDPCYFATSVGIIRILSQLERATVLYYTYF